MSLAREMGREEKASMFHDRRESLCVQVSMFRDVRESFCVTWVCFFLKGMGSHLRVEQLKAERVRQSLLVATMEGAGDYVNRRAIFFYTFSLRPPLSFASMHSRLFLLNPALLPSHLLSTIVKYFRIIDVTMHIFPQYPIPFCSSLG